MKQSWYNLNSFVDFFLGIEKLRFKPAFNPYTEPSMEVFSYHEGTSGNFIHSLVSCLVQALTVTLSDCELAKISHATLISSHRLEYLGVQFFAILVIFRLQCFYLLPNEALSFPFAFRD